MPDHLQTRTSDAHKGAARHRRFSPTTIAIAVAVVAVLAAILLLI
ncbi:hypothetical protein [uncultured Algimonas sp.]|nr:hypothetical protein [uncultured Algimonas sp.]